MDSIIYNEFGIKKPYVIINISQSDCILCRMITGSIYEKVGCEQIVMLSESRNLKNYFIRNSNIECDINFLYQNDISRNLQFKNESSFIIVDDDSFHISSLEKLDINSINLDLNSDITIPPKINDTFPEELFSSLDNKDKFTFKDTTLDGFGNLFARHENGCIIFNKSIQMGIKFDGDKVSNFEFDLPESVHNDALERVKILHSDKNVQDMNTTKQILKHASQPPFLMEYLGEEVSLFSMSIVVKEDSIDERVNYGIHRNLFIIDSEQVFADTIDSSFVQSFYLLDYYQIEGRFYFPRPRYPIKHVNGYVYATYFETDSLGRTLDESNVYFFKLKPQIGELKLKFVDLYELQYEANSFNDFFYIIDKEGFPIITNRILKKVFLLNNNQEFTFNELTGNTMNVDYVYDAILIEDQLYFIGLEWEGKKIMMMNSIYKNGNIIKPKVNYIYDQNIIFSGARFRDNDALLYVKKEDADELKFELLSFD